MIPIEYAEPSPERVIDRVLNKYCTNGIVNPIGLCLRRRTGWFSDLELIMRVDIAIASNRITFYVAKKSDLDFVKPICAEIVDELNKLKAYRDGVKAKIVVTTEK